MAARGPGRPDESARQEILRRAPAAGDHNRSLRTGGRQGWILLLLAAILGSMAAATGIPWLAPLLQALPAWWVLVGDLRRNAPWRGAMRMLVWALAASLATIGITLLAPAAAERGIFRGAGYREEMLAWIITGVGAESDPARFIPQHALHYGMVLGLSFASAGLAGLLLGTLLLNYMNFYVGSLAGRAASPGLALLCGWPPWSVLRVVGFILGAVAAAHLLLGPVLHRAPWSPRQARRMLAASLAFVLADIAVKAMLAPSWRLLLERALGR